MTTYQQIYNQALYGGETPPLNIIYDKNFTVSEAVPAYRSSLNYNFIGKFLPTLNNYSHYYLRFYESVPTSNTLEEISLLKKNWDYNGAQPFSERLVEKCESILSKIIDYNPMIFPSPRDSIQFELYNDKESYLEIEVFLTRINLLYASNDRKNIYTKKNISMSSLLREINEFFAN